jgi:hypothetical protein
VLHRVSAEGGARSRLFDLDKLSAGTKPPISAASARVQEVSFFCGLSAKPENSGIHAGEPGRRIEVLSGGIMAAVAEDTC